MSARSAFQNFFGLFLSQEAVKKHEKTKCVPIYSQTVLFLIQ